MLTFFNSDLKQFNFVGIIDVLFEKQTNQTSRTFETVIIFQNNDLQFYHPIHIISKYKEY